MRLDAKTLHHIVFDVIHVRLAVIENTALDGPFEKVHLSRGRHVHFLFRIALERHDDPLASAERIERTFGKGFEVGLVVQEHVDAFRVPMSLRIEHDRMLPRPIGRAPIQQSQ